MGQGSLKEEPVNFIDARRALCYSCEELTTFVGIKSCNVCGCAIWSKTMVRNTKCPKGKWNAEQS